MGGVGNERGNKVGGEEGRRRNEERADFDSMYIYMIYHSSTTKFHWLQENKAVLLQHLNALQQPCSILISQIKQKH
jgi:hypothetical protein